MNNWDRTKYDRENIVSQEKQAMSMSNRLFDKNISNGVDNFSKYVSYDTNLRNGNSQFVPQCRPDVPFGCGPNVTNIYSLVDYQVRPEYTMLSNPANTGKGTGVNRFSPLFVNPQSEQYWLGDRIGQNSRQMAIDQYGK
jgi:hypothetical protein